MAELVENTLVGEVEKLSARLAGEAEKLNAEQTQDLYEYHAEDHIELSDELPTILRYSVLTAADSALETYLNDTCETFAEVHKARVGLSDFSGRGIRRAKEYMKKVAGIAFPDESRAWNTVTRLHEIRNSIVHADAYVPPSRTDLRAWSGSIPGYKIDWRNCISLDRQFTTTALSAYEEFAHEFDQACEPLSLWHSIFPPVEEA